MQQPSPTQHVMHKGRATSVRALIADQTRAAHQALHVHPVLARLTAPDVRADEYRDILLCHLAFYEGVEAARKSFGILPALSVRPEIAALRLDVGKDCALPAHILPIKNPFEALGMLYVMHGSRFGATVIVRKLKAAVPEHAHVFFSLNMNKANWQRLLTILEGAQNQDAQISEIVKGTQKTFSAFDQWMHRVGQEAPVLAVT